MSPSNVPLVGVDRDALAPSAHTIASIDQLRSVLDGRPDHCPQRFGSGTEQSPPAAMARTDESATNGPGRIFEIDESQLAKATGDGSHTKPL
jgi:hypothetical protein